MKKYYTILPLLLLGFIFLVPKTHAFSCSIPGSISGSNVTITNTNGCGTNTPLYFTVYDSNSGTRLENNTGSYTPSGYPFTDDIHNFKVTIPGGDNTLFYCAAANQGALDANLTNAVNNCGSGGTVSFSNGAAFFSLLFPTDGSTIPDFNNWVISWSSSIATSGLISIDYGQASNNLQFHDQAQMSPFVSQNPLVIRKTTLLNPIINLTATSSWYAQATFELNGSTYYTNIAHFIISPNATTSISTSTILAGTFSPPQLFSSSTSQWEVCGLIHLDGCLINAAHWTVNFLFQPFPWATQQFESAFLGFQSVFPFSITNSISNAIQNSSSTTDGSNLNIQYLGMDTTHSYTLLTPTFLKDQLTTTHCNSSCAQDTKDTIFQYVTWIIWGMTGLVILKIL